jgi:hypothetical protein
MAKELVAAIGKVFVFAIPTLVTYFVICYSPYMAAKLIGTTVTDFLTNLFYGIFFLQLTGTNFGTWFKLFIYVAFIVVLLIKFHTSHIFLLQLFEKPAKKDFHDEIRSKIGMPPQVKFVEYRTPSCPPSPAASANQSQQQSRALSPIEFKYDSWVDLTPFPEPKYSDSLRVTTAPNCIFTDRAKEEVNSKLKELQKKARPHHVVTTSIASANSASYFEANTTGRKSNTLNILRSKPALAFYYFAVLAGYRLGFEYFYYATVRDMKVQLYKIIGVEGDNLRAKNGEDDTTAQNNFSMYLNAADKRGTICKKAEVF